MTSMTPHRVLAQLGALGMLLGACDPAAPDPSGGGGASGIGGASAGSGGTYGSGAGGTSSGGAVGASGAAGASGAVGTSGESGSGGSVIGGAGSGGMPPAAGAGGQAGGGSSGVVACPAGIGLCDDFEAQTEGMSPSGRWTSPPVRNSAGSTIVVDSTQAYSGSKALHVTGTFPTPMGGVNCCTAVVSTKPGDPAFADAPTTGYVRFMMYLGTFTQSGHTHARLVRIGNDTIDSLSNPQGYATTLHYDVPAQFKFEKFNDIYSGSVDPKPLLGKWVCWEYQVGPNVLNWWQDGKVVTSSTTFKQPLTLSKMAIGVETYTALPKIEFWLDDVAFDAKQRIGCPVAK